MRVLPFVLFPNEVLFREVDEVNHGLGRDEQVLVQDLDLKHKSINILFNRNFSV